MLFFHNIDENRVFEPLKNEIDNTLKQQLIEHLIVGNDCTIENIQKIADFNKIPRIELEKIAYKLLSSLFSSGKSKGFMSNDIDEKQLEEGIKVEMEHTNDRDIAKKIALDHLIEINDYYTRLVKMEEEAKKK